MLSLYLENLPKDPFLGWIKVGEKLHFATGDGKIPVILAVDIARVAVSIHRLELTKILGVLCTRSGDAFLQTGKLHHLPHAIG
jgi:hypothetical protein